jgi:hypothetical protein
VVSKSTLYPADLISMDKPWIYLHVMDSVDGTPSPFQDEFRLDPATGKPRTTMHLLLAKCLLRRGIISDTLRKKGYTITAPRSSAMFRRAVSSGAMLSLAQDVQGLVSSEEAETLVLILMAYSTAIAVPGLGVMQYGIALYSAPWAWCNTSCSPNARLVTHDTGETRIIAIAPIRPGDEVTIQSTLPISHLGHAHRIGASYTTMGFVCLCAVCDAESLLHHQNAKQARGAASRPGSSGDAAPVSEFSVAPDTKGFVAVCGTRAACTRARSLEISRQQFAALRRQADPSELGRGVLRMLDHAAPVILAASSKRHPLYIDPRLWWQFAEDLLEGFLMADLQTLAVGWEIPCDSVVFMGLLQPAAVKKLGSTRLGVSGTFHTTMKDAVRQEACRTLKTSAFNAAVKAGRERAGVWTTSMVFLSLLKHRFDLIREVSHGRSERRVARWTTPVYTGVMTVASIATIGAYCLRYQVLLATDKRDNPETKSVTPDVEQLLCRELVNFGSTALLDGISPSMAVELMAPASPIASVVQIMLQRVARVGKVVDDEDRVLVDAREVLHGDVQPEDA